MYAQSWALCCLVTVVLYPAVAAGTPVEVLLRNTHSTPDSILDEMKFELDALMGRAGFELTWRDTPPSSGAVRGDLVVVELRGSCEPPATAMHAPNPVQLGSSAVADGKILPFSWVDCTMLARALEPYLTHQQKVHRELAYGRAIARVLAHELYHVLAHTLRHTKSGLTKARFDPSDLLDERAAFRAAAMVRLPNQDVSRSPRPVSRWSINILYPSNHKNRFESLLKIR